MNLMPKKVKVGGVTYTIDFPTIFETGDNLLGLHNYSQLSIRITDKFRGFKLRWNKIHEVFIHEIFHAIDNVYVEGKLTESEISKLSVGMYQVLADNNLNLKRDNFIPKFVKVSGFIYKVDFPYSFIDEQDITHSQIKSYNLNIKVSGGDDEGTCSSQFIKVKFMESIFLSVMDTYLAGDCIRDYILCSSNMFGNGLYQVIVDNNIEEIIKSGIKEDKIFMKRR